MQQDESLPRIGELKQRFPELRVIHFLVAALTQHIDLLERAGDGGGFVSIIHGSQAVAAEGFGIGFIEPFIEVMRTAPPTSRVLIPGPHLKPSSLLAVEPSL